MDEESPPFEPSPELLESMDKKFAELEEEFGLQPHTKPAFIHWPQLTDRIYEQARFWHMDSTRPLVEIGRFGAIKLIGEGGFGAVYKAIDPELDRYVAVKLCPVRRPGTEDALKVEAKALARLKHANIITVYDVGFGRFEDRDAFFIVTEFIEAVSLRKYSPVPDGQHPREELLDIFSRVGEALVTAHEAGVVHGDIKPANIIFETSTRQPTIIDFGLAHIVAADVETIERNHGGTLPYMAPELLRGGARDTRTDQYAFCVSLWRCLDGRCPYYGRNTEEVLADIEYGEPVVRHDALVPERVRDVLCVGLREDPEERFADMRALLDELARARGPKLVESVVSVEPSVREDEQPKPKPQLTVLKGFVVGFALLSLTGALLALARGEPKQVTSETHIPPRVDPITEARQEFARAAKAFDNGNDRAGYKMWDNAYPTLRAAHPAEAGRRTLELANKMAQVKPKQAASAWMAVSAAEAFEQAALTGAAQPDHAKAPNRWELAAKARGRAAQLYTDAKDSDDAARQVHCQEVNLTGQSCKLPSQGY